MTSGGGDVMEMRVIVAVLVVFVIVWAIAHALDKWKERKERNEE